MAGFRVATGTIVADFDLYSPSQWRHNTAPKVAMAQDAQNLGCLFPRHLGEQGVLTR
jgi:hypothetical protein